MGKARASSRQWSHRVSSASSALTSVPTVEGQASRRGVLYEVANGTQIPNEGEKGFVAVTEEEVRKQMVLQVCDVKQGLLRRKQNKGSKGMAPEQDRHVHNESLGS